MYKVGLYLNGEGRGSVKIGNGHVKLENNHVVKSQVRPMKEQAIRPYHSVECNMRLGQSQQYSIGQCQYFIGIYKILVE